MQATRNSSRLTLGVRREQNESRDKYLPVAVICAYRVGGLVRCIPLHQRRVRDV